MRAYFFGNMYLSSIQQGIQAAHVTHELFTKYEKDNDGYLPTMAGIHLYAWAKQHKTMILLNGGYADTLRTLIARFDSPENPYPWTFFNEGQDSLDGALTSVGIVLPEKIYELASAIRRVPFVADEVQDTGEWFDEAIHDTAWEYSKWEFDLCVELNNYGLAS